MEFEELLANCEKEALHLSGKVQSFGALLCLNGESLMVTHVSANIADFVSETPEVLLGQTANQIIWLDQRLIENLDGGCGNRQTRDHVSYKGKKLNLRVIQGDGLIVVEVEKAEDAPGSTLAQRRSELYPTENEKWQEKDYFSRLLSTLQDLLNFERLMLYRFESDWVGEVVAEATLSEPQQYLGLKFPASDIPAIARKLYSQNPSRYIPDALSDAVDILSNEKDAPDLTWSDTRSVSPVHINYLENMGIVSSYSIPIVISGKLWGIVSCHHPLAKKLDTVVRRDAESLVNYFQSIFSAYLASKRLALLTEIDEKVNDTTLKLDVCDDTTNCLELFAEDVCNHMGGHAAAVWAQGKWYLSGKAIPENVLDKVDQAFEGDFSDYVAYTQNICKTHDDTVTQSEVRGVFAIRMTYEMKAMRVFVFRPPEAQQIDWAGNPDKSAQEADEAGRLSPRESFKKWTEIRGEESLPWDKQEQLTAKKYRVLMLRKGLFRQLSQ